MTAGSPGTSQLGVLITRLDPEIPLPACARAGDAGADLVTAGDRIAQFAVHRVRNVTFREVPALPDRLAAIMASARPAATAGVLPLVSTTG